MPSEYLQNLFNHTARISEEIGRTRELCARSMKLLRMSVPSTFLGRAPEPLRKKDEEAD